MGDYEQLEPISSLPTRIQTASPVVQPMRFGGRDRQSPYDPRLLPWPRSARLTPGNQSTRAPHTDWHSPSHHLGPSRHVPELGYQPLPLIADAGERPSSKSSLSDTAYSPVSRTTSAPPSLPLASGKQPTTKQVFSRIHPVVDWRKLPQPVFELVLEQLQSLHLGRTSSSCTTCYMRDLSSLESTCRAFCSVAQKHLYSSIQIVGPDSLVRLNKYKIKHGARLVLLRRTLRSRPLIASLVRNLLVPDPIIPLYLPNGNPSPDYDAYLCLLASLVMACPNLETFTGFHPFYNHTFDRLTHALSTRTKLKQHVWVIVENDEVSARSQKQLPPGLLDPYQVYQFHTYHSQWIALETLMLCSPASLGVLEHHVFVNVLHSLSSLKNLCVSSFDADDFNDSTLLALPHLTSLRLEECAGVSDSGLARWAASPTSILIERLSLIHQSIASLATIAKLLAGLNMLRKFCIIQTDAAPTLPLDMVVFQPLFASNSLTFLHWDIGGTSAPDPRHLHPVELIQVEPHVPQTPNAHLALSVLHHGFPSLTHLRAPRDVSPPGVIQSVCRPAKNANILLPEDRYSLHTMQASNTGNSLRVARIRAQELIDEALAARKEYMKVLVTDHTMLPSVQEMGGPPSPSTSRSGNLCEGPTSPDVDERADVDEARFRIGQDWDKEVVVFHHDDAGECRCTPTVEPVCRCDSASGHRHYPTTPESTPTLPPRSPLRPTQRAAPTPLKIQEFSLPTFIGRVSIHMSSSGKVFRPPRFHLLPDIEGRDGNGGVVGWGELLRVSERARAARKRAFSQEDGWVKEGCDGSWNRDRGRRVSVTGKVRKENREGGERWRHTERERGRGKREGRDVEVAMFF